MKKYKITCRKEGIDISVNIYAKNEEQAIRKFTWRVRRLLNNLENIHIEECGK